MVTEVRRTFQLAPPIEVQLRVLPAPPRGYRERAAGEGLEIEQPWVGRAPWHAAPAAIPWLGIGLALAALVTRAAGVDPRSSVLLLALLGGWLLLTLLFAWDFVTCLVNRTRIRLDDAGLHASHGPLPSTEAHAWSLTRAELRAFRVEVERAASRPDAHRVIVEARDGSRRLVLELEDAGRAAEIRDALSQRLT
jgi:hypothetical protein